jgi:hypothetical protein
MLNVKPINDSTVMKLKRGLDFAPFALVGECCDVWLVQARIRGIAEIRKRQERR